MSINSEILSYLKTINMSVTQLSKKLGTPQPTLHRLLNSDDIRVSQLQEITKALDLPITYFFDGKEHILERSEEGKDAYITHLEDKINFLDAEIKSLLNKSKLGNKS